MPTPDPAVEAAAKAARVDLQRFWRQVDKTDLCWLWTGNVTHQGYGEFYLAGSTHRAHRISWVLAGNSLTPGLVIDHICRVRECVNPDHLREVTHRENTLAGIGPTAINARKVRCKAGHEFDEENTYQRLGWRICRTCKREWEEWKGRPKSPCPVCGHLSRHSDMARHMRDHHGIATAEERLAAGWPQREPATVLWQPEGE